MREEIYIPLTPSCDDADRAPLVPWPVWQREVLALLRSDLGALLQNIALDDIDWVAWRCFYLDGKAPRAAVDRALERDL